MELVKILNYVKNSFEGKPSFILLMSDNKEYISNGYIFVENTEQYIEALIEEYDCSTELTKLFKAPSTEMSNVTNASYMFYNSKLSSFNSDMSNVINASDMFYNSKLSRFASNMNSVTYASYMFSKSNLTSFNSDISNVADTGYMFKYTPYELTL